jgi:RimJ/RimL family protein N-acetyltransferase
MSDRIAAVIETLRLHLDRLQAGDAAALFACRGDPDVARYQGWKPADEAEAAAFIARQDERPFGTPDGWNQLAIRLRDTGELVGDFGIHFPATTDDPIEFGISLKPAQQGHGYAREVMRAGIDLALGSWGYRRVVASVDPRNTASMALCRALGMRQEAHHVESYRFRGEWVDDVVFALLAREWPVDRAHADMAGSTGKR